MMSKSLLRWGVIAGPFYVTVSLAQAFTREGFDLAKHAWSLLSNGELGWIQVTNFILTGLMCVAAAVGLRRALTPGRGRTWAPLLIGAYGVSLVGAGIFKADPAVAAEVSWHGMLHFMVGGIGFACLIAACLVLGSRFARDGKTGLAWFSRVTGVVFLAGFAGIASGSHGPVTLAFVAAVLLVWSWLTTVCLHFSR
jgi:hypothetical protein